LFGVWGLLFVVCCLLFVVWGLVNYKLGNLKTW
jgi:fucose permease